LFAGVCRRGGEKIAQPFSITGGGKMRAPRTAREAAWLSLVHWRKMNRWVEKQNPAVYPSNINMRGAIFVNWKGRYCALCTWSRAEANRCHEDREGFTPCFYCPLAKKYGPCGTEGNAWAENVWTLVNSADTWAEWLKYGRRMERQIETVWRELR